MDRRTKTRKRTNTTKNKKMNEYIEIIKENKTLLALIKKNWPYLTATDRFKILNTLQDLTTTTKNKNQIRPYKYQKKK